MKESCVWIGERGLGERRKGDWGNGRMGEDEDLGLNLGMLHRCVAKQGECYAKED